MKVVLIHKTNAMDSPGGGEVQLVETAAALTRLGVETEVREVDSLDACPAEADVYHFFGTVAEFLPAMERLTREDTPCLVSTIAWYELDAYWHESDRLLRRLRASSRFMARAALPWLPSWRKRLYRTASMLLPNSQAEARQLGRYFGVPEEKIAVVPNGADPRFSTPPSNDSERESENIVLDFLNAITSQFVLRKSVLCIGRIEPRKNQLGLIRAWRETDHPLVFVGEPLPEHESYFQRCREESPKNTLFLGPIDHNDPALVKIYSEVACLALPSRFETPGLVALEAAMTGTPLVLTERGCTREYFGDLAEYVSPDDPRSLHDSIAQAIAHGRRPELARHALSHFTWDHAARATLAAYEAVRR